MTTDTPLVPLWQMQEIEAALDEAEKSLTASRAECERLREALEALLFHLNDGTEPDSDFPLGAAIINASAALRGGV